MVRQKKGEINKKRYREGEEMILYLRQTRETGREMARCMGDTGGTIVPRFKQSLPLLIRWGNIDRVDIPVEIEINKRSALLNSTDKLRSLEILGADSISVPPLFANYRGEEEDFFPAIARKRHHWGGREVVMCNNKADIEGIIDEGYVVFAKWIESKSEYRVHVCGGKCLFLQKKYYPKANGYEPPILVRSRRNGWLLREQEGLTFFREKVIKLGIRAVSVLGLDFGVVDILLGVDGRLYVLEVNSAPGLRGEEHLQKYADGIKDIIFNMRQRIGGVG